MKRWIVLFAIAVSAAAIPAAAPSQAYGELAAARRAGQVGERYDGYLGMATAALADGAEAGQSPSTFAGARSTSTWRSARGVTPQVAGFATGCELLVRVPVGEAYMLQDGVWRRRQVGQVIAQPSYCG